MLPGAVARAAAGQVMRERVFVFYCHPYELDARELRTTKERIPLKVRLHQGLGRGRFQRRLEGFLRRFGGRTMLDALEGAKLDEIDAARFA